MMLGFKSRAFLLGLASLVGILSGEARASGTPAGTSVSNVASATYLGPSGPVSVASAPEQFIVEELVDVSVTLQSVRPLPAFPGASNQVLTYRVTNLGNGLESFRLTANSSIPGDDFDPILTDVFLDANGNGVYDVGVDVAYVPGSNDPSLDGGVPGSESVTVFVLNDMPAGIASGALGENILESSANTLTGAPGLVAAGAGDAGTDAMLGLSGGIASANGAYQIEQADVVLQKSALVTDAYGGSLPIPGSVIRYQIDVFVTGSSVASNVVIRDVVPTYTTYVSSSLALNGVGLTDAGGDDAGDYNVSTPGQVTVRMGDLDAASTPQQISFSVTID